MNETEGRGRNGQYLPFLVAEGVVLSTRGFFGVVSFGTDFEALASIRCWNDRVLGGSSQLLAPTSQHLASKVASLYRPNFYWLWGSLADMLVLANLAISSWPTIRRALFSDQKLGRADVKLLINAIAGSRILYHNSASLGWFVAVVDLGQVSLLLVTKSVSCCLLAPRAVSG